MKLRDLWKITDVGVLALTANLTSLYEFVVQHTSDTQPVSLTFKSLHHVWNSPNKIHDLTFTRCIKALYGTMPLPPINSRALRVLDLSYSNAVDDEMIDAFVSAAPLIRTLKVMRCVALSDAAMFSIAKLKATLKHLEIGYLVRITDEGAVRVATTCQRLEFLDIASTFAIRAHAAF